MLRSIFFKNLRTRARKLDPRQTGLAPSFRSTRFAFWGWQILPTIADWSGAQHILATDDVQRQVAVMPRSSREKTAPLII
jgi:hypothetical protein